MDLQLEKLLKHSLWDNFPVKIMENLWRFPWKNDAFDDFESSDVDLCSNIEAGSWCWCLLCRLVGARFWKWWVGDKRTRAGGRPSKCSYVAGNLADWVFEYFVWLFFLMILLMEEILQQLVGSLSLFYFLQGFLHPRSGGAGCLPSTVCDSHSRDEFNRCPLLPRCGSTPNPSKANTIVLLYVTYHLTQWWRYTSQITKLYRGFRTDIITLPETNIAPENGWLED